MNTLFRAQNLPYKNTLTTPFSISGVLLMFSSSPMSVLVYQVDNPGNSTRFSGGYDYSQYYLSGFCEPGVSQICITVENPGLDPFQPIYIILNGGSQLDSSSAISEYVRKPYRLQGSPIVNQLVSPSEYAQKTGVIIPDGLMIHPEARTWFKAIDVDPVEAGECSGLIGVDPMAITSYPIQAFSSYVVPGDYVSPKQVIGRLLLASGQSFNILSPIGGYIMYVAPPNWPIIAWSGDAHDDFMFGRLYVTMPE